MIKQHFECDICHKEFTSRDEKGNPRLIGGVKGVMFDKQYHNIDYDLCEGCYAELINFLNNLKHERK